MDFWKVLKNESGEKPPWWQANRFDRYDLQERLSQAAKDPPDQPPEEKPNRRLRKIVDVLQRLFVLVRWVEWVWEHIPEWIKFFEEE